LIGIKELNFQKFLVLSIIYRLYGKFPLIQNNGSRGLYTEEQDQIISEI